MLESDADGVGVWSTADTTLVAQVRVRQASRGAAVPGSPAGRSRRWARRCRRQALRCAAATALQLAGGCRSGLSVHVTAAPQVNNATFAPFAQLCDGKYGSKPTQPEHTVLAVNPAWTSSRDIGQPWDRWGWAQAGALCWSGASLLGID
jgi:hypothetical protein